MSRFIAEKLFFQKTIDKKPVPQIISIKSPADSSFGK